MKNSIINQEDRTLISNLSYDTEDGSIRNYVYTYTNDDAPVKSVFPDGKFQTIDLTDIRKPIRKAEIIIENQIAKAKETKKDKKGKVGTNSKPSNVPYENGQKANEQAQKHGYADAHDLKR